MLKGVSTFVSWIFGALVILTVSFIFVGVVQGTMEKVSVDLERGNTYYKSQAAALHVMDLGGEKGVIEDMNSFTTEKGEGCSIDAPGFPEHFRLYTGTTGNGCPLERGGITRKHIYLAGNGDIRTIEIFEVKPVD